MWRAWLAIPLAIVAVALLVWYQRRPQPFFVSGLIEAEEIRVGSRVGGRVNQVNAFEGKRIEGGEVLLELEAYDLSEQLARARAALTAAQAELEKLNAGFRQEEIQQARARRDRFKSMLDELVAGPRPLEIEIQQDKVTVAEAELVRAEAEYERVRGLAAGERATAEMDEATRALSVARARLDQARHELVLMKEGTRAEEIAQARAGLAEAEAALALLEKGYRREEIAQAEANAEAARAAAAAVEHQIRELRVVSPIASVVEAIDLQPGDLIAPNAPVISLLDRQRLWVRAYVPENRLNLRVGQRVSIAVDAFAGRRFAGSVSFIARSAEFTPSNVQTPEERVKQVFRIKVDLDEGRDELRAGMYADVFLGDGQ